MSQLHRSHEWRMRRPSTVTPADCLRLPHASSPRRLCGSGCFDDHRIQRSSQSAAWSHTILTANPTRPIKNIMSSSTTPQDPYRLPRHTIPTHYDLRIEPDLSSHSFTGHEVVTLTVAEPTAEIVLNATELEVSSAILSGDERSPRTGTVHMDEELQRCRISFPSVVPPGEWKLSLSFRGTLNDKLRGFYRSNYKDEQGIVHTWQPRNSRPQTRGGPSPAGTNLSSKRSSPSPW